MRSWRSRSVKLSVIGLAASAALVAYSVTRVAGERHRRLAQTGGEEVAGSVGNTGGPQPQAVSTPSRTVELLTDLLKEVVASSGQEPESPVGQKVGFYSNLIPIDLRRGSPKPPSTLWLTGEVAASLFRFRDHLADAWDDGQFEHLEWKGLWRALWRLVCEAWLARGAVEADALRAMAREFEQTHARQQEDWLVDWEIDHLSVGDPITIANVAFLRFDGPGGERWPEPEDTLLVPPHGGVAGRAFARVAVRASTREKALERAREAIDDALHVFRTVMVAETFIPHQQLLQKRGANLRAEQISGDPSRYRGARWEHQPYDLGISGDLLPAVRGRAHVFGVAFDGTLPPDVAEAIRRCVIWIGSSVTREEPDDKVLDLWRALESLLCGPSETSNKAAIVGLRYILAAIAAGENAYFRGPLELWALYQLRNDIAHGSARRLGRKDDASSLLMVAKDALEQVLTILRNEPGIGSMDELFAHIQTRPALEQVLHLVERNPVPQKAQALPNKAREWLNRLREEESAPRGKRTAGG